MVTNVLLAVRDAADDQAEQEEILRYMMKFANWAYPTDAAQVIILMESIRTVPAEIRMYKRAIRRGRLNAAECLFLVIKYTAIVAWCCDALIENSSWLPNVRACTVVHNIFYFGMFLDVFFVAVAIAWRTYVIYGCSRKAYWILCAALALHLSITLFTAYRQHKTNTLMAGFCSVAPYPPVQTMHMAAPYFLAFNVLYDAIITAASTYRLVSASKNLHGLSRISRILFHNNVHYAAIVCTVNAAEFIYMISGSYKRRSLLNISCALQVITCLNLLINEQDVVHDAAPAYISRSRTMASSSDDTGLGQCTGGAASNIFSRKSAMDGVDGRMVGTRSSGIGGGVKYVVEQHSLTDVDLEYGKGTDGFGGQAYSEKVNSGSWGTTPTSSSVLFVGHELRSAANDRTPLTPSDSAPSATGLAVMESPTGNSSATSLTYPVRLPSYDDIRDSHSTRSLPRPSTGNSISIRSIREGLNSSTHNQAETVSRQVGRTETRSDLLLPFSKLSKVAELPSPIATQDDDGLSADSSYDQGDHNVGSKNYTFGCGGDGSGARLEVSSLAHLARFFGGNETVEDVDEDRTANSDEEQAMDKRHSDASLRSHIDGISSPALCQLWQDTDCRRHRAGSSSLSNIVHNPDPSLGSRPSKVRTTNTAIRRVASSSSMR